MGLRVTISLSTKSPTDVLEINLIINKYNNIRYNNINMMELYKNN